MPEVSDLKTWLFVPASQQKFVRGALASQANAFILDLEDSIPPAQKGEARGALPAMVDALRAAGRPIYIRVNKGDLADLKACAELAIAGVVLPKVETADEIEKALDWFAKYGGAPAVEFVAAIESAVGIFNARDIAQASSQVTALMFGSGDFIAETGFAMDPDALAVPAALISLAAKAAGKCAIGLPASIAELKDLEKLKSWGERARSLGYSGTPIIHPKQVEAIEAAFSPSADELAHARRIIAAFEASTGGATSMDGSPLEMPFYLHAKSVVRRAGAPLLDTHPS